jgi:hypothetical protein
MKAISSIREPHGSRCVDILLREDGSFIFREFRQDVEDAGRWTLVADYSQTGFATKDAALDAAAAALPWLRAIHKS